ncbi:MAG: hypothetical protein K8963_06890 [Proteobacteria bacterium]|nr:hypothetical protein [Pseudomonadota bacterium]
MNTTTHHYTAGNNTALRPALAVPASAQRSLLGRHSLAQVKSATGFAVTGFGIFRPLRAA